MSSDTYTLEFLVKADSWAEVVDIFDKQLKVTKNKKDTSTRDMKGLFLVSVSMTVEQLNKDFYDAVRNSDDIAIVSDPSTDTFREIIMYEAKRVEGELRKLLFHVSDLVEQYYEYFSKMKSEAKHLANNSTIVSSGYLDPMTSFLSFEEIMIILEQDLSSWDGKTLTANDIAILLENTPDIDTLETKLKEKMNKIPVWNYISEYLLENKVVWEDIRPELNKLKNLRNKAAHFNVLLNKDVVESRKLAKSILTKISKKKNVTKTDIGQLRTNTYSNFIDVLAGLRQAIDTATLYKTNMTETMKAMSQSRQIIQDFGYIANIARALRENPASVSETRQIDKSKRDD